MNYEITGNLSTENFEKVFPVAIQMFKYCFVLTLVTMDYTLKITDEIQRKHCV
jgi:hypothetical protein